MNYSIIAFLMLAFSLTGLDMVNRERRDNLEATDIQAKSGQFVNYVYAFDTYYQANSGVDGDVTASVPLPTWLPKNSGIKMYVSNKIGYVYMPVSKGVFNEVLKITDFSSAVGVTDASSINTVSGKVSKPGFIGINNIVYVR
ncbi:TPA: type IV pilus biogenesis protein PilM [Enterobacter cloacae]|uniref:type IV pilus biogenesis protein PilM n=1 Tax=Enterobacter hormaechei TaxID=158836 RepID=UPI0022408721|nr:type IV pilus biogenesis protein PilM [Enterobacter hormaechei]HAV2128612.1 type IV pilus biogenesis protein PilM [Enterobacter cloacae]HBR4538503.1 type IV pilus biogenesis protein PilM [Klebsiella pneumoniae]MDG4708539.1 type IV pilus biogenesis protein PilM [Enterobacter hormaechei]WLZ47465.1 type IV pilus biogenesis protein PilM [Enterobacter hormaechei]HAV2129113.1 type IV pilus biogenesis protein PilM [Enterobacter cloacae]